MFIKIVSVLRINVYLYNIKFSRVRFIRSTETIYINMWGINFLIGLFIVTFLWFMFEPVRDWSDERIRYELNHGLRGEHESHCNVLIDDIVVSLLS